MEIALLPDGLKLKGKQASFSISSTKDLASYNGFLPLVKLKKLPGTDLLIIDGAGEYEVSGVKISTQRTEDNFIHSLSIDGVSILIGELTAMEKIHSKLAEHDIIVLSCPVDGNPSFASSLATHATLFYGEMAKGVAEKVVKQELQTLSKFQVSADKFLAEMQTVLLA